jgi:hypothetical protein
LTHAEAHDLLAAYALGAMDDAEGRGSTVAELERHLDTCEVCRAELARYLEDAADLGEAVRPVKPPEALRAAVLAAVPQNGEGWRRQPIDLAGRDREQSRSPESRRLLRGRLFGRIALSSRPLTAAAAVLILALLVAVWGLDEQIRSSRSELALDERGLALLTSTETTVVRLDPVSGGASQEHGHWYHRAGINTQVLVVEFMPALAEGESYFGWLGRADGSWVAAGRLSVNADGYGRLILLGDDGSGVRSVLVTRQTQPGPAPTGDLVLRWTAS